MTRHIASFWVYVLTPEGRRDTPLRVDAANNDPIDHWLRGIDVYEDLIALSIADGIWIGTIRSARERRSSRGRT